MSQNYDYKRESEPTKCSDFFPDCSLNSAMFIWNASCYHRGKRAKHTEVKAYFLLIIRFSMNAQSY